MAIEEKYYKNAINQKNGLPITGVQSDFVFSKRNEFSRREVGLNHPDNHSFLRLADSGDIEIMAAPGVGIVISAATRSISIFADTLKIYTTEDDGIRWNSYSFNYSGSDFTEPFLVPIREYQKSAAYHDYMEKIQKIEQLQNPSSDQNQVTIDTGLDIGKVNISKETSFNQINSQESYISEADFKLLEQELKKSSQQKIDYMKQLIYDGYTFSQAKLKAERDLNSNYV
jgi:hypothetical protein